ncbi:MAG: helix-turn-helix domain-containing protein [Kofleriaceae bacterium]|nr:helix-turn-helix domain-containing protein [Kofleriaceae bacterium]
MTRRPGRPSRSLVTRPRILAGALAMLEAKGLEALTMRALARQLGVDPMALYHYFPDKHALLRAAAAALYTTLPPARARSSWQQQLVMLAEGYLGLLARAGELLRYLSAGGEAAAEPTRIVRERFRAATSSLAMSPGRARAAHDVFVDFVHGFSLGVPRTGMTPTLRRMLRAELGILLAGMRM